MRLLCVFVATFLCIGQSLGDEPDHCVNSPALNDEASLKKLEMVTSCRDKLKAQVQSEIQASMTYLKMGAYFASDKHYRPGFSKFFFEAANEERQHAIKIIEYMLMRGALLDVKLKEFGMFPLKPRKVTWRNALDALKVALDIELSVTRSIKMIATECEKPESKTPDFIGGDYHLVDYLSEDFLSEQYKGQRDLAGKISVLSRMMGTDEELGEFLLDKKLLNGEV